MFYILFRDLLTLQKKLTTFVFIFIGWKWWWRNGRRVWRFWRIRLWNDRARSWKRVGAIVVLSMDYSIKSHFLSSCFYCSWFGLVKFCLDYQILNPHLPYGLVVKKVKRKDWGYSIRSPIRSRWAKYMSLTQFLSEKLEYNHRCIMDTR